MELTPLALTNVSPRFRTDLRVERKGPGMFTVQAPEAPTGFAIYDFELSLARMLDGRRTLADVIEAGMRIGIPINLDSLDKFIRQMRAYSFLAEGVAPAAGEETTWKTRETWDESTRELYQSGLRLTRQGRYGEAKSYFDAILELDPQNPEALEKRAEVEQLEQQSPDAELLLESKVRVPSQPQAVPRSRIRTWAVAAGGAAVLFAAAGYLQWGRTPAGAPPAAATLAPVRSPEPAPKEEPPEPRFATVQVLGVERLPLMQLESPAEGRLTWSAPEQVRVEREQVVAEVEWMPPAQQRVVAALDKRIVKLERMARKHSVYEAFVKNAKAKRERLQAKHRARRSVRAPQEGLLVRSVADGEEVTSGARIGRLDASDVWSFRINGKGPAPKSSLRCEVTSLRLVRTAPCNVVEVQVGAAQDTFFSASISARLEWVPEPSDLRFTFTP